MQQRISPARALRGSLRMPGDKSISHRYAMLSAIAGGASRIRNYSTGADCQSTLGCLRALGVAIEHDQGELVIHGRGLEGGLREAEDMLDAANSGSTMRMLSGILAGQDFTTRIGGDESLSRRPMQRIMQPLAAMGARVEAREGRFPPLTIHGGKLHPIDYAPPVASAQVKSCVLLAGLYAEGETIVREPAPTRDHTEIALRQFGARVEVAGRVIRLEGRPKLAAQQRLTVPGDLSSAAFFLVAALIVPGSSLVIEDVGLNPTRAALIDFLVACGAELRVLDIRETAGERVGDLAVRGGPLLDGGVIEGELTAALIDEIPALAVLGAVTQEGLVVRDAAELRVKETDRISTIAENLRRMGIQVEVAPDGMRVAGRQRFGAAEIDSFGDHRIAMAFAVAALAAGGECVINGAEAASVSFPEFYELLGRIAGR